MSMTTNILWHLDMSRHPTNKNCETERSKSRSKIHIFVPDSMGYVPEQEFTSLP